MLISVKGTGKSQLQPGQQYMEDVHVLSITLFPAKKPLTKTDWCAGALS